MEDSYILGIKRNGVSLKIAEFNLQMQQNSD